MPSFKANDLIRVHLEPKRFLPSRLSLIRILENQPDWLCIFKPAGVPSHETLDNQIENAKSYTEKLVDQPLWGLGRLDVGTSGLLLFAKSPKVAQVFNLDVLPKAEKIYQAHCPLSPSLNPGIWIDWMKKEKRSPRHLADTQDAEFTIRCELEVLSVQKNESAQKLKIKLITGRTHQIRAQMAKRGTPILGDALYGSREKPPETHEEFTLCCEEIRLEYLGSKINLQSSKNETTGINLK